MSPTQQGSALAACHPAAIPPTREAAAPPADAGERFRIDVPCALAGFAPPPCPTQLRFTWHGQQETQVRVTMLTLPGRPPALAKWIEEHDPISVSIAAGLSPRAARAEFRRLPSHWTAWMEPLHVHEMQLHPDGMASIFVSAEPETITAATERLSLPGCPAVARPASPAMRHLTSRQHEVLMTAARLGYYDVPHGISLRQLGERLGVSVGAVSTVLRRAEAGVVHAFLDEWCQQQWKDHMEDADFVEEDQASYQEPINLTRPQQRPWSDDSVRRLWELLQSEPMPSKGTSGLPGR